MIVVLVVGWYVIQFGHTLSHQEGKAALLRAAKSGNTAAVRRELRGHTDVNSQDEVGFSPFSCSIKISCYYAFLRMDGLLCIVLQYMVIIALYVF